MLISRCELDARLLDGSLVHLRPVDPGDAAVLAELFEALSPASQAFRFFTGGADLHRSAELLARVDQRRRFGVLATRPGGDRPIGHGTYWSEGGDCAEVAFAIADEAQGLGLATVILAQLAAVARGQGIRSFFAEVLPENHRMIEVFVDAGFEVSTELRDGLIRIEFPTGPPPAALRHFVARADLGASTEANP